MSLEVRKATSIDADDLLLIINEAHQFKLSHGDEAWETQPYTYQDVEAAIARDSCYIVRIDGKPAGSVVLIWNDERSWGEKGTDEQAGYIHQLATRNAFRGQHIGEQIINWACDQIRANGRSLCRLDCSATNTKLCTYYEKQGFKQVGTNTNDFTLYERSVTT